MTLHLLTVWLHTIVLAAETAPAQQGPAAWITTIGVIVSALFGATGIATIIKNISDKRRGKVADEISLDQALNTRVQGLLDSQIKYLIDPLNTKVKELEGRQIAMQAELDLLKGKYQIALRYARRLKAFIDTHLHHSPDAPPEVPEELKEEI